MEHKKTLALPAPAKLNLFLHIVGRRPDGYHELQTVFQLLNYSDTLDFSLRNDPIIQVDTKLDLLPEENLVWRAAKLLQTHTRISLGATITLEKIIPLGGGLGGGSSDAATTLVGLNDLWKTQLSVDQLAELGKTLGADVPVFVRGHSAWAEGIGEILTPITLPEDWFFVLIPPCNVITREIYAHPQLTRDTTRITIDDFLHGQVRNDFETLVKKLYPPVAQGFEWLSQFTQPRLTGSGACIFARFSSKLKAHAILEKMPNHFQGFVAQGMNSGVSPSGKARGFDLRIPRFES